MRLDITKVKLRSRNIKRIYFDAFPKNERMPFFMIFIMFLAVDESLRAKGYGSAILKEIKNRYPDKKIMVSIEPCDDSAPDIEVRKRRKAFYRKNGYGETGYMIKLSGVVQEIMITNGDFDKKEFLLFFIFYSNGTVWPKIWLK